jgi:hypothetical protein
MESFLSRRVDMPKFDAQLDIDLLGPEGNAFVVLAKMRRVLESAGASKNDIDDFMEDATTNNYDHLLEVCREWVWFNEI